MDNYGILSIIPPLIAIVLAIVTRQVIVSLVAGLFVGYLIIAGWSPLTGTLATVEALVDVFAGAGNTRTILFTLLIGSLIRLVTYSGGVNGFVLHIQKRISQSKRPASQLQTAAGLTGFLIFIESNISILTVGTIFRSLFDKYGISRVKLAYIADSSSAPSCILFPLNAWGAYIIGLLATYDGIDPFGALVYSIPFNFYPLLTLVFVFYLAGTNKSYWAMKAEEAVGEKETYKESAEAMTGKARHMLLPLLVMILTMPLFLVYTGWSESLHGLPLGEKFWQAIADASGSSAVLYAVIAAVIFAGIYYRVSGVIRLKKFISESVEGMKDMLEMALLMVLAFAISSLCKNLGTGLYVASIAEPWLSPALAPALIFITSSFIAFSTGTSWGTFAIMIAIAVPLAQSIGINLYLALAAVLGGGVFGDHCSPVSDTTLIASMASGTDHIRHVRTQLPYALLTGGLAVALYLIVGVLV